MTVSKIRANLNNATGKTELLEKQGTAAQVASDQAMTSLRVSNTNLANQLEVRQAEIEKLKTAAPPPHHRLPSCQEVQIRAANANLLKGPKIERSRITHHNCVT